MSHILSGRNKPSLDFVLKVLAGFPDLNPQWLLQGKGKMYANMAEVVEVQKMENPEAPLPFSEAYPEPYDKGESLTDALLNMAPAQEVQEEQAISKANPKRRYPVSCCFTTTGHSRNLPPATGPTAPPTPLGSMEACRRSLIDKERKRVEQQGGEPHYQQIDAHDRQPRKGNRHTV